MSKKYLSCPCGGLRYDDCCGRFLSRQQLPATALQLMRSRYTAYVLRDEAYVRDTWYFRSLPAQPLISGDERLKWAGLEIRQYCEEGDTATVEFIARYKMNGRAERMHELSRFLREKGQWFYVDGSLPDSANSAQTT